VDITAHIKGEIKRFLAANPDKFDRAEMIKRASLLFTNGQWGEFLCQPVAVQVIVCALYIVNHQRDSNELDLAWAERIIGLYQPTPAERYRRPADGIYGPNTYFVRGVDKVMRYSLIR